MKSFKLIIIILVIFLKTGNVLSNDSLFNVNNIKIPNKLSSSNEILANKAIEKAYEELIERVLLQEDFPKLKKLPFNEIKELVSYYQILEDKNNIKIFNIFFDKDKFHNLFFRYSISYSDVVSNELYLLPILKEDDQLYIYSKNYFYKNWNKKEEEENQIVEFILPLENIEIIQKINLSKNNFFELKLKEIFKEYSYKNLALVLIEGNNSKQKKIFLKLKINGKDISKTLVIKNTFSSLSEFSENIILIIKKEIVNIIKSRNLIDIRTPSFINVKFKLNKKNNLVELNKRIKNIDLIENIYVQKLNNQNVFLKIKYLGNINKIIEQLKNEKIILNSSGDQWNLRLI